ncbi:hypothetical protein BU24DRAFT_403511 [Aaosphaeria arxii CBS 175.79]|uniref:Uncharacterized protein n=1 Tax=Aaosphaeria arxii CBS 175.79 TaxID=1450172 RepID=A0A6A5Y763_9PLEO|nr:uncharacterized protein BU24DRAFT_403511 [Aaosphaeria arxii CBS 175.79]KAF2020394.1 hypothetical protein BU24DRAFT_403511 [Aaosphaeria arxii CBS 175.79]
MPSTSTKRGHGIIIWKCANSFACKAWVSSEFATSGTTMANVVAPKRRGHEGCGQKLQGHYPGVRGITYNLNRCVLQHHLARIPLAVTFGALPILYVYEITISFFVLVTAILGSRHMVLDSLSQT